MPRTEVLTFSGNFSRFIEASKQSPKSICNIFPLKKKIIRLQDDK
jgi:hypothetical protein